MYITFFNYRHVATDAADSPIFAMRVPAASATRAIIKKVKLTVDFDGTTAASRIGYGLSRYTVADPTGTGATSPVRVKMDTKDPTASTFADANIKYGTSNILTLTNAVFEGYFHQCIIATSNSAGPCEQVIHFDEVPRCPGLVLNPGEGLVIRNVTTAVVGQGCSGSVWWEEVT